MRCACRSRRCRNPRTWRSRRRCARPARSINWLYSRREAMKVWQIGVFCVVLVSLAGCKSLGLGGKRVDYGAEAGQVPVLEVPPDLTVPPSDERFKVPQGDDGGVATYSEYRKGGAVVDQASNAKEASPSEAGAASAAAGKKTINASGPA